MSLAFQISKPRPKRVYVKPADRRKRGGQLGNLNALKHGRYTLAARARRRAHWLLLLEARWLNDYVRERFLDQPAKGVVENEWREKRFRINGPSVRARPQSHSAIS